MKITPTPSEYAYIIFIISIFIGGISGLRWLTTALQ